MRTINAVALSEWIDSTVREMKVQTFIEETRIGICEFSGMQVHIVVTRNKDDFLDFEPQAGSNGLDGTEG